MLLVNGLTLKNATDLSCHLEGWATYFKCLIAAHPSLVPSTK